MHWGSRPGAQVNPRPCARENKGNIVVFGHAENNANVVKHDKTYFRAFIVKIVNPQKETQRIANSISKKKVPGC